MQGEKEKERDEMQDVDGGGEIGLSFSYLLYAISFAFVLKLNFESDKYAFDTEGDSEFATVAKTSRIMASPQLLLVSFVMY